MNLDALVTQVSTALIVGTLRFLYASNPSFNGPRPHNVHATPTQPSLRGAHALKRSLSSVSRGSDLSEARRAACPERKSPSCVNAFSRSDARIRSVGVLLSRSPVTNANLRQSASGAPYHSPISAFAWPGIRARV